MWTFLWIQELHFYSPTPYWVIPCEAVTRPCGHRLRFASWSDILLISIEIALIWHIRSYFSYWNRWNISKLGQSGSVRARTSTYVERLTWNDSTSKFCVGVNLACMYRYWSIHMNLFNSELLMWTTPWHVAKIMSSQKWLSLFIIEVPVIRKCLHTDSSLYLLRQLFQDLLWISTGLFRQVHFSLCGFFFLLCHSQCILWSTDPNRFFPFVGGKNKK